MRKAGSKVLRDAMQLNPVDRADLISELIATLDAEAAEDPAEVEAAWNAEIAVRVAAAESGEDPGRPWEEVLEELQRGLPRR